jgi:hypothetical protein
MNFFIRIFFITLAKALAFAFVNLMFKPRMGY